jgi:hypothetical protein
LIHNDFVTNVGDLIYLAAYIGLSAYRHLTPPDESSPEWHEPENLSGLSGFMAIAAPTMKAALQAWSMKSNLVHQGWT